MFLRKVSKLKSASTPCCNYEAQAIACLCVASTELNSELDKNGATKGTNESQKQCKNCKHVNVVVMLWSYLEEHYMKNYSHFHPAFPTSVG